jgi:hypothetical protein
MRLQLPDCAEPTLAARLAIRRAAFAAPSERIDLVPVGRMISNRLAVAVRHAR